MPPPAVTFVVPCFNHGAFVARAVSSALGQRGAEVRVIVVDDGSDDARTPRACDALEGPRVRVLHQPNRGLPAARNAGAALATTPFLAFLDADDWVEPTFASELHAALERGGEASAWAYAQTRIVGREHGLWRVPAFDPLLLMVMNLHSVTALVRRDRFEAVGGFDETMTRGYEDWDLWLRFAERGWRGVRVERPLFNYRRHRPGMLSRAELEHARLYRELISRHRAMYDARSTDVAVRAAEALMHQRRSYERMLAVRASRAVNRVLGVLRTPFSRAGPVPAAPAPAAPAPAASAPAPAAVTAERA